MRIGGKKKSNIIFGVLIGLFVIGGAAGAVVILKDEAKQSSSKSGKGSGVLSLDDEQKQSGDVISKSHLECVPAGLDYYRTNSTLAIDPKNPDTVFVGIEFKGIYKSTDGGKSWKTSDNGIKGYAMESDPKKKCIGELGRIFFDPTNTKRVFVTRVDSPSRIDMAVGETAGMYESTDGGSSWKQIIQPGMNAGGSRAVGIDSQNSNVIYFGIENSKPRFSIGGVTPSFDLNKTGILYKSSDGGKSWSELPTGVGEGLKATNLHIDSKNPAVLWLATTTVIHTPDTYKIAAEQKGLLKSTNGGQSWKSFLPQYAVMDSAMSSNNGNHLFVSLLTTDGYSESMYTVDGNNFQKSSTYMRFARYDPHDPTGMRMLGYSINDKFAGIYESKDGGKTWNPYANAPPGITNTEAFGIQPSDIAWNPVNKNIMLMSGSGAHLWWSDNGGKGWSVVLNLEVLGANKNKDGQTRSRGDAE